MAKTLYRIHTEDRDNLPELMARYFGSFTLLRGTGYWDNTQEQAAVIEILAEPCDRWKVMAAADTIREVNRQESVYVTSSDVMLTDVREDQRHVAC